MEEPEEFTTDWRPAVFKLFHSGYKSLDEGQKKGLDNLFGLAIKFKLKGKKLKGVLLADPEGKYDYDRNYVFKDLKSYMCFEFFDERNNREDFKTLNQEKLYKTFKEKAFNYLQKEYWGEEERHRKLGICSAAQDKVGDVVKTDEDGEPQPQPDRNVSSADAIKEVRGECAEMCSIEKHGQLESVPDIKKELRKHGMNPKDVVAGNVSVPEHLKELFGKIIYERMLIAAGIQCSQINKEDAEIYLDNRLNNKKNKKT